MRTNLPCRTFALAAALLLCSGCSDAPSRVVFLLFDTSASSTGEAARFDADARRVLDTLRPGTDRRAGDLVAGDAISSSSFGGARLTINGLFPRLNRLETNSGAHREAADSLRNSLAAQIDSVLATPPSDCTDLISSFSVAGRVFQGHPDTEKVIVVFSDMIETCSADFYDDPLTADDVAVLIDELKEHDRLPNLRGVEVWIAGLGSTGNVSAERAHVVEAFWVRFFEESGASVDPEHVGPTLLNWDA